MRIAFDIRMIKHSGIGTYVRGLLEGFAQLGSENLSLILVGPENGGERERSGLRSKHVEFRAPIYSIYEQLFYPVKQLRDCHLLHFPHYNLPLRFGGKLVVTIHDLNHYLFPHYLPSGFHRAYARFFYRRVVARAQHIIAISPKTKNDLMTHLSVPEETISLIPYALSETFRRIDDGQLLTEFKRAHALPDRYLLSVGINKPHKNYDFLIRVLSRMWKSDELDMPLVICGTRKGKRANLESLTASLGVGGRVIFVEYLTEENLQKLYSGAAALIFPSLYEGFGMPPLEAMGTGIPVLASRREPMTWVVGEAALLFDPQSEEELTDCIRRILSDSELRASLVQKGYRNLERFSWKRSAEETLAVYRGVAAES
jgi:glycosyltransferase involved in cell wall biosynthesis